MLKQVVCKKLLAAMNGKTDAGRCAKNTYKSTEIICRGFDWSATSRIVSLDLAGSLRIPYRAQCEAMGDIYSDFLDELLSNIRTRSISWEAQQRSGVIDEGQVRTIKTIDKQRRENRADIVAKV
jgi:hypothetical protein